MAAGGDVAFELERFEWVGEDRLEVVGRWKGMSGRRLARPVLFVEAGGHRRRLTAMPGGRPPAAEGELWKAVFGWAFGADDVEAAELEVARSIVVDLPAPRTKRRVPGATSPTADIEQRRDIEGLKAQVAELSAARDAAAKEAEEARAAAKAAEDAQAAETTGETPVEAPAPDSPGGVSADEHEAVVAELAAARTELEGAKAELATARSEAPGDAPDPAELGDQIAALRAQNGELRHELGEALDGQERVADELRKTTELQMESDRAREQLMSEVSQMRADMRARDEALERARLDLTGASEDIEKRLEAERAATADVRAKLADAREEAQRGLAAEAEETERVRTELGTTREEAERTLAIEREETSRLRAELSEHTASDTETTDGSGRRMYESIAKELERERSTVRELRRELDTQKAQSADQRRAIASAATNGVTTSQETPLAATPAGRSGRAAAAMAARADAAERSPLRRAEAARAAAAHRVPEHHHSPAGVWAVRATAVVLVAVLLVALIVIISSLA